MVIASSPWRSATTLFTVHLSYLWRHVEVAETAADPKRSSTGTPTNTRFVACATIFCIAGNAGTVVHSEWREIENVVSARSETETEDSFGGAYLQ